MCRRMIRGRDQGLCWSARSKPLWSSCRLRLGRRDRPGGGCAFCSTRPASEEWSIHWVAKRSASVWPRTASSPRGTQVWCVPEITAMSSWPAWQTFRAVVSLEATGRVLGRAVRGIAAPREGRCAYATRASRSS